MARRRRKRDYGSGSIVERPKGSGRFLVQWRPAPGVRRSKTVYGTRKEAEKFLADRIGEAPQLSKRGHRGVLLEQYAEHWLQLRTPLVTEGTQTINERAVHTHLLPVFGHMRLDEIRRSHLSEFQAAKVRGGPPVSYAGELMSGPPLSPATVDMIMITLRLMLDEAVADELLLESPFYGPRPLKRLPRPKKEMTPLTEREEGVLLQQLPTVVILPVLLMLHLGLRIGEALGLRVTSFDPVNRQLHITGSNKKDRNGRWYIGAPKSEASRRTLTVGATLSGLLAGHIRALPDGENPRARLFSRSPRELTYQSIFREKAFTPAVVEMRLRMLTAEQLAMLRDHLDRVQGALVSVFARAHVPGLRLKDLCPLRWSSIDLETRTLRYLSAQGQQCEAVLPEDLLAELLEIRDAHRTRPSEAPSGGYVFPVSSNHIPNERFIRELRDLGIKLDLWPRVTPHDLRHTYASRLIARGTNPKVLSFLIGHSRPSTTLDFYTHFYDMQEQKRADTCTALPSEIVDLLT